MADKKSGSKPTTNNATIKSKPKTGRAKPLVPKAGITKTKRRYGCGGKLK